MPATFWTCSTTPSFTRSPPRRGATSAQCSTECPSATRSRSRRPSAPRACGRQRRERAARARRARPGRRGRSAAPAGEEVVEDRVRREHGQTGRGRLVDDLVGRAGAHVVDEHVVRREAAAGISRARTRRRRASRAREAELRDDLLELGACASLVARERRAVHVAASTSSPRERHGATTSRAPSPASSARARAGAVAVARCAAASTGTRRGRSRGRSRATFGEWSGNERRSTLDHRGRHALGGSSRRLAAPVREPEQRAACAAGATSGAASTA